MRILKGAVLLYTRELPNETPFVNQAGTWTFRTVENEKKKEPKRRKTLTDRDDKVVPRSKGNGGRANIDENFRFSRGR
jgi:hypothetical protein